MQDPYVIMNTGFKNTAEGGTASGYQLDIRIPYYRSVYLSAIHSLDLSVDGEPVPPQDMKIVVAGKTFTIAQMFEADSVRWGFGDPATMLPRLLSAATILTGALLAPLDRVRSGISRPGQDNFDTQSPRGSVLRADRAAVRFDAPARYGKSEAIAI